jgi:hypothetical protein
MGLRIVGNLVADARCEDVCAAISELSLEFTVEAKQDVPLLAPMIGEISR